MNLNTVILSGNLTGDPAPGASKHALCTFTLSFEGPFGFDRGTLISIRLKHNLRKSSRNIGRFRLSVSSIADSRSVVVLPCQKHFIVDRQVFDEGGCSHRPDSSEWREDSSRFGYKQI